MVGSGTSGGGGRVVVEEELPPWGSTDAFSYGELIYEGGEAKESVAYHGKMPALDQSS